MNRNRFSLFDMDFLPPLTWSKGLGLGQISFSWAWTPLGLDLGSWAAIGASKDGLGAWALGPGGLGCLEQEYSRYLGSGLEYTWNLGSSWTWALHSLGLGCR